MYLNEYEEASVNVVYSNLDFRLLSQIRLLYLYISYGEDGETLQQEWNEIKIENKTN